jgi:hypothetical protein
MNPATTAPGAARADDPTGGRTWPLWGMALVAVATLGAVAWQRSQTVPVRAETDTRLVAAVTWQRALHFEDRADGSIAVLASPGRAEVARLQGEQGFLQEAERGTHC